GDDVDEAVLNYAEVKALAVGNPLIKERVELINELDKYKLLYRDYIESCEKKERRLKNLPQIIETQERLIKETEQDIEFYKQNGNDYEEMDYEDQKAIRDTIYLSVVNHVAKRQEKKILNYQGFDVVAPIGMQPKLDLSENAETGEKDKVYYVYIRRNGSYQMEIKSVSGITKRLNNLLEDLPKAKIRREEVLETLLNKKSALEAELAKEGESYATQIAALALELEKIDKQLGVAA
ncbi:MAG: hypothetical protein J6Q67_02765, partial [Clostridia bacterium]|nr:hypothetical protein [Clostridia bacterium]